MARPREFDEPSALRAAMHMFWSKGYEATSISDLTEAMGVSRSTLYSSFGEKDAIFDRAMALYTSEVTSERYRILRDAESVRQGLRDYLEHHVKVATSSRYPGGCLLVNVACGDLTDRLSAFVAERASATEKALRGLLERGQKSGEISKKKDIHALARTILATSYGIHVLSRMKRDRKNLEEIVDVVLASLD